MFMQSHEQKWQLTSMGSSLKLWSYSIKLHCPLNPLFQAKNISLFRHISSCLSLNLKIDYIVDMLLSAFSPEAVWLFSPAPLLVRIAVICLACAILQYGVGVLCQLCWFQEHCYQFWTGILQGSLLTFYPKFDRNIEVSAYLNIKKGSSIMA